MAVILTDAALNYRADVLEIAFGKRITGSVRVRLYMYMPRQGKFDLDNFPKVLLDSLTFAKVWKDDSQVDDLRIVRCAVEPPGRVEVTIEEIV